MRQKRAAKEKEVSKIKRSRGESSALHDVLSHRLSRFSYSGSLVLKQIPSSAAFPSATT